VVTRQAPSGLEIAESVADAGASLLRRGRRLRIGTVVRVVAAGPAHRFPFLSKMSGLPPFCRYCPYFSTEPD